MKLLTLRLIGKSGRAVTEPGGQLRVFPQRKRESRLRVWERSLGSFVAWVNLLLDLRLQLVACDPQVIILLHAEPQLGEVPKYRACLIAVSPVILRSPSTICVI